MKSFGANQHDDDVLETGRLTAQPGAGSTNEPGHSTADVLSLMMTLADDLPELTIGRGVAALANFLTLHHKTLSDDQAATILSLGAGLWRRGISLDDCGDGGGWTSATKQ